MDKIRERQALANIALEQSTSLQEEFNVKNNNFAAVYEKTQKRVLGFIANNQLTTWIKESIVWFGGLINVTEDADGSFARLRNRIVFFLKILAVAITAFISYKAAVIAVNLWTNTLTKSIFLLNVAQKASHISTTALRNLNLLWAASTALATGNTDKAAKALRIFNATALTSPLGGIIALIGAAVAAYVLFAESADRATAAQKAALNVQLETERQIGGTVRELKFLMEVAKDETRSLAEREAAVKRLNEITPDHIENLELEKIGYLSTKKAIDGLIESMEKEAQLKAVNDLLDKKNLEKVETENAAIEKQIGFTDRLLGVLSRVPGETFAAKRRKENVDAIQEEIKALEELRAKLFEELALRNAPKPPKKEPDDAETDGTVVVKVFTEEELEAIEKRKEALKKLNEKLKELRRELELSNMEADQREIEAVRDKYQKLIDENLQFSSKVKELEALREQEITSIKAKQEERRAEAAKNYMAKFQKQSLEDRLRFETQQADELLRLGILNQEQYDFALTALREKYLEDVLKREEDAEREKARILRKLGTKTLQEQHQDELAELKNALNKKLITYEEYIDALDRLERIHRHETTKAEEETLKEKLQRYSEYVSNVASAIRDITGMISSMRDLELAGVKEVVRFKGETEDAFTLRKEAAEKERAEIVKKYAYREALGKVANIVASTAEAVMKSVSSSPTTFGLPWSAVNAAIGLTQAGIAMAQAQKIKGYEDGLYPVIDQYNRKYKAPVMSNAKTGPINEPTILVGEKPEIIIDPKTKKHLEINYPEVIETIYQSAGRMKGYESGYYPQSKTMPTPAPSKPESNNVDVMGILNRIEQLFKRGVPAYFGESEIRKIRASIRAQEENEKKRILK